MLASATSISTCSARAPIGGCGSCSAPTPSTAPTARRALRGVGAERPQGVGRRRLERLGRRRRAASRRAARASGPASSPKRRRRAPLQVRRSSAPTAASLLKADPMALAHRAPAGDRQRRRRRPRRTSGATSDWMASRGQRPRPSAADLRGAPRRRGADGVALVPRPRRTSWPTTSARWASRTSSCCPVAEHPFGGSWGYQVTGYYAPTSRFGAPDDFRAFVDTLHQRGIGVIVDWVPAHFPRTTGRSRRFDGTALYEHADPRQGEHPDWGTLRLQLRPQRGAQLPRRQRPVLARRVPHRRAARRRRRHHAVPRLLPRARASGSPTATAVARTSTRSTSCAS